jgi:fumarate hydratase class II
MGGWANLVERDIDRMKAAMPGLLDLAIGGTAVGTGLNSHPEFGERAAKKIAELTGLPFKSQRNKFAALSARDQNAGRVAHEDCERRSLAGVGTALRFG